MSSINKFKIKKEKKEGHKSPSNLLKTGIDSLLLLFENKNNEYYKKISEYQIIINNLQIKNKKLIKENYILKKNNTYQNKLIKDLRNENNNLNNIINNIKGKLSMELSYTNIKNITNINHNNGDINNTNKNKNKNNSTNNNSNINNKSFNYKRIKIKKVNINDYGENNRTRNMSNFSGNISSSSNKDKDAYLTDRFHKKNNVLSNSINFRNNEYKINKRLFSNRKLEKNFSYNFNDNSLHVKDNYYSRQRTKNNSFKHYNFNNEISNKNNLIENKRDIKYKINKRKFIENENYDANLKTLNKYSCSKNLFDKYINDSKNVQIYNTIELY